MRRSVTALGTRSGAAILVQRRFLSLFSTSGFADPLESNTPLHHAKGSEKYDYDLVVIGGGSGGLSAAKAAGRLNAKVACLDFVQPSPVGTTWGLGGTCVNVGCIPKKLMHIASLHGEAIKDAPSFGWNGAKAAEEGALFHDWESMVDAVQLHIKSLNFGYRNALRDASVKYINAYGTFLDAHTIETTDKTGKKKSISADKVIIAVGGRPSYLDIPGSREHCITSDDLFSLKRHPGRTLCIGASYVSLECAGFLSGLGCDSVVMMRSIPLRGFDQQMAARIVDYMESTGTKFLKGFIPTSVSKSASGRLRVEFKATGGNGERRVEEFDTVVQAVGRDPLTKALNLEAAGVQTADDGRVIVSNEQTTAKNIFAVGDCVQDSGGRATLELTPVAIQAGTLLSHRLFGGGTTAMDYRTVPTTVFTPLEYGVVGLAEEAAIEEHGADNIEVYHTEYTPLEWALSHRETPCYMKVVCNRADRMRILGMHVLGPNAGEQIQGYTLGVKLGATMEDLRGMVGIHPTNAEYFTTLKITKRSGQSPATTGC